MGYEALYYLRLQLSSGILLREYTVISHGCLPRQRCEISARVFWTAGRNGRCAVCAQGRPACTRVEVLAHIAGWTRPLGRRVSRDGGIRVGSEAGYREPTTGIRRNVDWAEK